MTNIQNVAIMCLRVLIRGVTMTVASVILTLSLSPRLALVVCVVLPFMAAALGLLMKICFPLFEKMQKALDHLNETVQENLIAVRVVKSYVRENHEREKFFDANNGFTAAGLQAVLRIVAVQPVMMICFAAATVLVLYNGGNLVLSGGLNIGDLQAVTGYIMQILMSAMMIGMAVLQYTRAQASIRRVFEVLDAQSAITDGGAADLPAPRGRVEFQDVSFRYQTEGAGEDVLRHINLTVEPGEFVAIVGGTGTGKSSLVNLIPRFYDAHQGRVLVDGLDVRDYPLDGLRGRIGMVLQNNVLFSGTIRENLLWGNENADSAALWKEQFLELLRELKKTSVSEKGKKRKKGKKADVSGQVDMEMTRYMTDMSQKDGAESAQARRSVLVKQGYVERLIYHLEKCNKELLALKRECEDCRLVDSIEPFVQKLMGLQSVLEDYFSEQEED